VHLNDAPFLFMLHTGSYGIKMWAEEDRPREKMMLKGKAALSDAELIAILLGSGTRELTAVELARHLMALSGNNLVELGKLPLEKLMELKGVGEAKAISIAAALELGRRRQLADFSKRLQLNNSKVGYELLAPLMSDLPHEEFWVVLLNKKLDIMKYKCISQGGLAGTVVDQRIIFSYAITEKAASIVLAHNHPSGSLKPSQADVSLTRKLKAAGQILDIPVNDHLIITDRGYYSFADDGIL
jgi:DNA repair protein RadC